MNDPVAASTTRANAIGYRLAFRSAGRCTAHVPLTGLALQSLDQFAPSDRATAVSVFHLDRGPRIVAVAPDSPGAAAGTQPGDVILSIDDRPLAPVSPSLEPFDQRAALAALDRLDMQIASQADRAGVLIVLRDGVERRLLLGTVMGCPLHLHVANSTQRNAFADGFHVLLPTGFIDTISDDDQLALVIAHEMAHNLLGHAAAQHTTAKGARRALVRQQEDEADRLGADLALDAGYDVVAGSKVFLMGSGGIDLFPVHGTARSRIDLIAKQVRARQENTIPPR